MSDVRAWPRPCHLYHLYDAAGALIYVGMTDDVDRRMRDHETTKTWWVRVTSTWVVTYPSRAACAAAEALAIHLLRPRYNIEVPGGARCDVLAGRVSEDLRPDVAAVVEIDELRKQILHLENRISHLRAEAGYQRGKRQMAEAEVRDWEKRARSGEARLDVVSDMRYVLGRATRPGLGVDERVKLLQDAADSLFGWSLARERTARAERDDQMVLPLDEFRSPEDVPLIEVDGFELEPLEWPA